MSTKQETETTTIVEPPKQDTKTKKPKKTDDEKLSEAREKYEAQLISNANATGKTAVAKKVNQAVKTGLNRREKSKLTTAKLNEALTNVISNPDLENIKTAIAKLAEKCPEPKEGE